MEMVISVAGSVREFDVWEWSSVARGRGLYASRPWHSFLEADPSYDAWYITARRPSGSLLGVLPVHLHAGGPRGGVDSYYDPVRLFDAERVASGDATTSTLLLGGRAGYSTQMLLDPRLPDEQRAETVAALVTRARQVGAAFCANGLAALYLTPDSARDLASGFGGQPILTDVAASIPLDGLRTFDDYLATLSGHRRRRVAHEVRQFAASGLRVRTGRLSEWCEPAADLLAQSHGRYGHADNPRMLRLHFEQQAEHLDDLSRVVVCERDGEPVAFVLIYEWEETWYARAAGVANGWRGAASVFFNAVYYAGIERAVERGMSRYDVGPSSLKTKLLRGAVLEPRWSLLEVEGLPACGTDKRTLAEWRSTLATVGHAPVVDHWREELTSVCPSLV
jgi:hypothetical protein